MSNSSLVGAILADRYEIICEVGRGALGVVYKARHLVMEKTVAVKVLFGEVQKDETNFLRFQREAQAASSMSHPNIVVVYDFGISQNQTPFLVMDFVEGTNLKDVLQRHGKLPIERAVAIFLQMASALEHAHSKGILHRDIKPENVVLMHTAWNPEFVKLVDFGIAKYVNEPSKNSKKLTMDGEVLGTPAYMSPEQILGNKLDARSDIYCLGVLMYHTISGSLPILGINAAETMSLHVTDMPKDLAEACTSMKVPHRLSRTIMKTLKKHPQDRHQTMRELLIELENYRG
ncbi:MAG: serine/threonine-protein kinase [Candidatus Obscuribacterales bacterium]